MKKVLSMVLAVAMMLSMVGVAFAAEAGAMSATVDGPAPKGGEVEVSINFDTNPGFWMGTVEVCYPAGLTYKESADTGLFGADVSFVATHDAKHNLIQLKWENAAQALLTETGTAAVLTFTVSSTATFLDSFPITFQNVKMADLRAKAIPFGATGCDVTVQAVTGCAVRASAGPNGSISPVGDKEVAKGENVRYTITADQGYHVSAIEVNDVSVVFQPAPVVTYTMQKVEGVNTIHASFEAHTWDKGTVKVPATCTAKGTMTYKCTQCGTTEDRPIDMLPHDCVEVILKEATCTEAGEKAMDCKNCDYIGEHAAIPAKGHDYQSGICASCGAVRPSSSSGGGAIAIYTLTFETNGGTTIAQLSEDRGTIIDLSGYTTTKEGYIFAGWYTDKNLTKEATTSIKLNKNITVYAKWEKDPASETVDIELPFTDVDNHWAKEAIAYAYRNGFMKGVSDTEFGPDNTLTRGMVVTILYSLEGKPVVTAANPFSDVSANAYYANAITWAASKNVVAGISEDEFAPDALITREQLAIILFRYSELKGNANTERAELSQFTDHEKISDWALESMKWAVANNMFSGTDAGALEPQGATTRAQCAQILYRFLEKQDLA